MKTAMRLRAGLLAICLMSGLAGCLHPRTKVIDPNTEVCRLPSGTNWTTPRDGYFVPDATMLRILDRLSEKDVYGK